MLDTVNTFKSKSRTPELLSGVFLNALSLKRRRATVHFFFQNADRTVLGIEREREKEVLSEVTEVILLIFLGLGVAYFVYSMPTIADIVTQSGYILISMPTYHGHRLIIYDVLFLWK